MSGIAPGSPSGATPGSPKRDMTNYNAIVLAQAESVFQNRQRGTERSLEHYQGLRKRSIDELVNGALPRANEVENEKQTADRNNFAKLLENRLDPITASSLAIRRLPSIPLEKTKSFSYTPWRCECPLENATQSSSRSNSRQLGGSSSS